MKDILWTFFELVANLYQQAIIVRTLALCLGHKFNRKVILFMEISWLKRILLFEGLGILISALILYIYAEICLCGQRFQKVFLCTSIVMVYVLYQKLKTEQRKWLNYEIHKRTMHSQEDSAEELQELYLSIKKISIILIVR